MNETGYIEKNFSDDPIKTNKSSSNEELINYIHSLEEQLELQKEEIKKIKDSLNLTEQAVISGKELISRILESLPFPVYIRNSESKILLTNSALLKLTGKSSEEVIGKTYVELIDDLKTNEIIGIAESQEDTLANDVEARYLISANKNEENQIGSSLGISLFSDNITFNDLALTKAKVDITNEKKLFEAVMDALPVGVATVNEKGKILRTNSMFDIIWGKPRPIVNSTEDNSKFQGWWLDSGKKLESHEWASVRAIEQKRAIIGQLLRIKRFDGSEAIIINSASPVYNSEGKISGSAVAIQDISFYIKTEEALRTSEQRFHSLFNNIDEGFSLHQISCDESGNNKDYIFIEVNPAFERITGLKNNDIKGKSYAEVLPNDSEFWNDIFDGICITGEPRKIERYFASLNKYFQLYIYSPLPNQYATVFIDITEQKTSQLQIQRQNAILQAINQIAHETVSANTEDEITTLCLSVIESLLQSKSSFMIKFESERKIKDFLISASGNVIMKSVNQDKNAKDTINFEKFTKKDYSIGFYSNDPEVATTFFKLTENHPPLNSIISIPLIHNDRKYGFIGAVNKPGGYTADDLEVLEALSMAVNQAFLKVKTKNALLESEEKFRHVFQYSPFSIVLATYKEGKILEVNESFEAMTGFGHDEVLGKTLSELGLWFHEKQRKIAVKNIIREGISVDEIVLDKKSGAQYTALSTSSIIKIKGELAIISIVQDVTLKNKMERDRDELIKQIEHERNVLASLINSIPDEVWFCDENENLLNANTIDYSILGIESNYKPGKFSEVMANIDVLNLDGTKRNLSDHFMLRSLKGEVIKSQIEVIRNKRNGNLHYREVSSAPIKGNDDRIKGSVAIIRDITNKMHIAEALRQSEEKYRSLFEAMNEGAALLQILVNKDKKPVDYLYLDVNPNFLESFNLKRQDILGKKSTELYKKPTFLNIFHEVAVSGKPISFETYLSYIDQHFRISAYSIENLKIAVLYTNITARKRMEEALRESEEKYRLLFNKMIDGFSFNEIILDTKGKPIDYKFLSVNPAFEKQTSKKAVDVIGKKASEVLPVSEQHWCEVFGAVAMTGESIEFEYFRKSSNRYYKVSAFSTRKGYFAVIYNDITNRKLAEMELQKTKNYLENLINHSNSPIVVWNTNFEIQLFNNAFEHLTGYLAEEVIGNKIDFLFPEDSIKSSKKSIQQLLSSKYWESVELPIYCKNEETRIVLWNIANIYDNDNTIISTIAQGNDITERKKTLLQLEQNAKELHELNATKDKFFGIIAHDLKNPFSSILAASEILSNNSDKFEIENIKKFSNVINSSANNAHILLENLLEWSRSQTGSIKFNPQPINLKELLQKSLFCFEASAVNKKITITSEVMENICINADKNMLNTILRNLINNAVKFTHPGGVISVKAISKKDEVIIIVKDTGIGIKKADIEKLFRIDIKYTNIGTANERGTGLGLLLCKEFVEKHGGKIWVESKVGKGSEFKFSIPLSAD